MVISYLHNDMIYTMKCVVEKIADAFPDIPYLLT
jgi:hypothetical protein